MDDLTQWVNKIVRVTTNVGSQAWHYTGKVISISITHITLEDKQEGTISIPLANAMIREATL
jgi:hypothetical protein